MARLGDVCNIKSGYAFKSEMFTKNEIPIIRIGNITENGLEIDNDICFDESFWNKNKNYRINKDDVLVAMSGATVGKSCINKHSNKLLLNQRVASISGKNGVENKYVYYFVSSPAFMDYILEQSVGCAQPNISIKQLCAIEFYLPNLKEQKEIVGKLDKVYNLIALRREQLSKLDELVKARFVELFGEVETNVNGFAMKRMDECCKFIGGAQPDKSHFQYEKTDDNIRLIQIRDYKSDRFITYIPKSLARKTCTESDIMIGRYGPPIFQILGGIEGAYNVALMKAVPTNEFNVEYFRYFLKDEKLLRYLESFSQRTAGQDGIQIDKLNSYPCFIPPIELQNEFANFVSQIDKSKFEVQQSLEKLETLKKALMQQYFG